MDFEQVLKEVVWRLITEGRISYRRIKLSFALDDDGLEELRSELIGIKRVASTASIWSWLPRDAWPDPKARRYPSRCRPCGSPRGYLPPA